MYKRYSRWKASMLVKNSPSDAEGGYAEHNPVVMNSISVRATLSQSLRDLFDLLEECIEGIGRRKPLRHFSFSDSVCVKHKFHRSKILWDLTSGFTQQGCAAYSACGQQTSATHFKNGVKKDLKNETLNPYLQFQKM
jgi:hypothetical protein